MVLSMKYSSRPCGIIPSVPCLKGVLVYLLLVSLHGETNVLAQSNTSLSGERELNFIRGAKENPNNSTKSLQTGTFPVDLYNRDLLIIGGTAANNAYPWFAKQIGNNLCGGSLIAKNWVLTAQHCFYNLETQQDMIPEYEKNGKYIIGDETFDMVKIFREKPLDFSTREWDYALVCINGTAKATPVPYDTSGVSDGYKEDKKLWVAGLGIKEDGSAATELMHVEIKYVNQTNCKKGWPNLKDRTMCAVDTNKGACNGDSGGPLIDSANSAQLLVGVVSYGNSTLCNQGKADKTQPNVFTRVSKVADWIETTMKEGGEGKPSQTPSQVPSLRPSSSPSQFPSAEPSESSAPSPFPSPGGPSRPPSPAPSPFPTSRPSSVPSEKPTSSTPPSPFPTPRPSSVSSGGGPTRPPSPAPSPFPTPRPSSVPSEKPTLPPICVDSTLRFKVFWNGRRITRDCEWIGNRATLMRCDLHGVAYGCPNTCKKCDECEDSSMRFKVFWNSRWIHRDCTWIGNRATKQRCALSGVAQACRLTCGLCTRPPTSAPTPALTF